MKKISALLSPDLLKCLAEMGHGDELVLADANFPGAAVAQRLIRCDGIMIPALLEAVLQVFPLDTFVAQPVSLMAVGAGDAEPPIWSVYRAVVAASDEGAAVGAGFEEIERFAFYERAKKAFAVVQSGEGALYANMILKKGVIHP